MTNDMYLSFNTSNACALVAFSKVKMSAKGVVQVGTLNTKCKF